MSPTDWNLISLFSVLGDEYRADIPDNPKLFFTNLCLGYRSIEKISGGDVSAQMRHDSIYLRRLASIVKPKVIICLGAATFLAAASGLLSDHELAEHHDDLIRVATAYNTALDERKNHLHVVFDGVDCDLFTVGHPGFMGISNRNRYSKMKQTETSDRLRIMKEDWKEIKLFL